MSQLLQKLIFSTDVTIAQAKRRVTGLMDLIDYMNSKVNFQAANRNVTRTLLALRCCTFYARADNDSDDLFFFLSVNQFTCYEI